MWWFGFQLAGVSDGAGSGLPEDTIEAYNDSKGNSMHFGAGLGLTLPVSVNLYRGLGFRTALSLTYSGRPFDPMVSQISFIQAGDEGGYERIYRTIDGYRSSFVGTALLFDLQYSFPLLLGTFKPYLGAGPGIYLNYVFGDLSATEEEFALLDPTYNDLGESSNNVDPYSVNLRPGFNGHLGVNIRVTGSMHLNFEGEYQLASMPEAPLLKATDGMDARRAAYTYSVVRISSGVLFNF